MSKKWFSTGFMGGSVERIDRDAGVIYGATLCQVGEAKGHGLYVDEQFINELEAMGTSAGSAGLKARFGHPNMCSTALGTFLGRWKNPRTETRNGKLSAVADLFVSNSAKESPGGNLYDYVFSMAENDPDMFGASIVFQRNEAAEENIEAREDGLTVARAASYHGADLVDTPAATDNLFEGFNAETFAAQVTEFLDMHPKIFDVVQEHPEALEEFMARYAEYKKPNPEADMPEEKPAEELSAEVEDTAAELNPETEELETSEAEESEALETAEPVTEAEEPETELSEAEPSTESINPESIAKWKEEFGAEIVVEALSQGGGYEKAKELHYAALAKENEQLKANVADLEKTVSDAGLNEGADPAEFGEDKGKKLSMIDVIRGNRK